jgi:hypothetical protein
MGGIMVMGIFGMIVFLWFLHSHRYYKLGIFDFPNTRLVGHECDYKGLRQVEKYVLEGNAVTNPSIHVSVHPGCGNDGRKNEKIIFVVDGSSINDEDEKVNLVAFDTLAIAYKRGLRVFTRLDKVVFSDSTLNINVIYREIE